MNKSEVKRIIEVYINTKIITNKKNKEIIKYPFTNSPTVTFNDKTCNIVDDSFRKEEYISYLTKTTKTVEEALPKLLPEYRLSFLLDCYALTALSADETARYLIDNIGLFSTLDNDINVRNKDVLEMLQETTGELLTDDEKKEIDKLDDVITVYKILPKKTNKKYIKGVNWIVSDTLPLLVNEGDTLYSGTILKRNLYFVNNGVALLNRKELKGVTKLMKKKKEKKKKEKTVEKTL